MLIYGHRGARNECPENTLASFELAYKNGIRHFELDIQLTKDQQLVVIHDTTTNRTTGHAGRVKDMLLADIIKLDARTNTPAWPVHCPVPTLESVVQACPETFHWQFEVKPDDPKDITITAQKLLELIDQLGISEKVTITSSSKAFLKAVHAQEPKQSKGLVFEKSLRNPVKTALSLCCDYLILHWPLCNESVLNESRQNGIKVSCWTVNQIPVMQNLKKLGVHSIITDYPTSTLIYFSR